MIKTVEAYMERYQMIEEGDRVVAGVSGGADSVCLLLILSEYCNKKKAELCVVHFNHGIRKEAGDDARFVEELCKELKVPFYLYEKDIIAMAKEQGIGTEEAGRNARYEAFNEVLRIGFGDSKGGKIAVAHNRNDLAETTLFHLFRGSSIAGLSGIAQVRDNIIRPLLCVERKEIEKFLQEKGRSWCIDSTNAENTYTRNKIRNMVFPYVEKEICSQAVLHTAKAAEEIAQVKDYLDEVVKEVEKNVMSVEEGQVLFKVEEFLQLHIVIQKQLILKSLSYLIPARKDLGMVHVMDILSLFTKDTGKQIMLPYGMNAVKMYNEVKISRNRPDNEEAVCMEIPLPGKICYAPDKYMEFKVFSGNNYGNIPQKTYTKWFDYDKIINCLVLRNRQTGDYLTITEDGKCKSIKEYFIEEKIPRMERAQKLLLADGQHILWVIGKRISEAYKVTKQTQTILQVTILGEDEYK